MGTFNKKHTEETKRLMSVKQKEKWARIKANPELYKKTITNIGNASRGRVLPRGEKSFHWKGGRYKQKRDGYIYVSAPKDHPYIKYGGGGGGGYVLEHRLVMEKVLGRYLKPDEDVNHINGVKDDNRPENLAVVRHYAHYKEMQCPKCEFVFRTR